MVRRRVAPSRTMKADRVSSFETPAEFTIGPRFARTRWRLLRMRGNFSLVQSLRTLVGRSVGDRRGEGLGRLPGACFACRRGLRSGEGAFLVFVGFPAERQACQIE